MRPFHLQGHRGARGLAPENTLPSFERALDAGVTSIETDVFLSADGVPVLCHDPVIDGRRVCELSAAEVRQLVVDRNPDPGRFPDQSAAVAPVAGDFTRTPFAVPTLADLFAFVTAYATDPRKSAEQRVRAGRLVFDLELKRTPFRPELCGADLHQTVVAVVSAVQTAGLSSRAVIRSFDHRAVALVRRLSARIRTAVLIANTAPVDPAGLAAAAGATIYCPDFQFVDAQTITECRRAGVLVLPWTVNDPADWERLVMWGVDGITTDYPDRLAAWLAARGIAVA